MKYKVSDVCQLVKFYNRSLPIGSVTASCDSENIFKLNGTMVGDTPQAKSFDIGLLRSANYEEYVNPYTDSIVLKSGHKYYACIQKISGSFLNVSVMRFAIVELKSSVPYEGYKHLNINNKDSEGIIFSNDQDKTCGFAITYYYDTGAVVSFDNYKFTVNCFDLTEMYGAGNEPTTVAQFKSRFPNDVYPYCPNLWIDIHKFKLLNRTNLFDISKANTTSLQEPNRIKEVRANSVIITTSDAALPTNNGYCPTYLQLKHFIPEAVAGQTYTLTVISDGVQKLIYTNTGGNWWNGQSKTITQAMLDANLVIYGYSRASGENIGDCEVKIQIEKGSSATPYVPYGGITIKNFRLRNDTNMFDISKITGCGDYRNLTDISKGEVVNGILIAHSSTWSLYQLWKGFTFNLVAGKTYTISGKVLVPAADVGKTVRLGVMQLNNVPGTYLTTAYNVTNYDTWYYISYTFTPTISGPYYLFAQNSGTNEKREGLNTEYKEIQLEEGGTATPYVPYNNIKIS